MEILTDDGRVVPVEQEDAEDLYYEFSCWRHTEPRSRREKMVWDAVMDLADLYLCDIDIETPASDVRLRGETSI